MPWFHEPLVRPALPVEIASKRRSYAPLAPSRRVGSRGHLNLDRSWQSEVRCMNYRGTL